ncbi:hypothetical protein OUZ56_005478 [Daphnia magna]|uniref:HTH psq-type domain-containing protein n=1 Tax=Daphnia magna TaxID=35525 RepID=A0ABQ9YTM4_9CRUS|nr:hypothetical protein OUZ56_005478 [Daphnia magna]
MGSSEVKHWSLFHKNRGSNQDTDSNKHMLTMAYTSEDLENAVATYVSGEGSYRSIVSVFGIPKTTLSRKFRELSSESKKEICLRNFPEISVGPI